MVIWLIAKYSPSSVQLLHHYHMRYGMVHNTLAQADAVIGTRCHLGPMPKRASNTEGQAGAALFPSLGQKLCNLFRCNCTATFIQQNYKIPWRYCLQDLQPSQQGNMTRLVRQLLGTTLFHLNVEWVEGLHVVFPIHIETVP